MDYQFLIELGALLGFSAFGLSKGIDLLKTKANAGARVKASQINVNNNGFSTLISNIDTVIDEQHKLRAKMISAGATAESLKPLDVQIQRLEWVRSNKSWLQFVAPYADQIAGAAMRMMVKVMK